jgi:hypothetical protein
MQAGVLLDNFLNPVILFFFLGILSVVVRSDLSLPAPLSRFLSLYLLLSIGLKGGIELRHSGMDSTAWSILGTAVVLSAAVPWYAYYILKRKLNHYDSGAIAATYGSISAVTFVTGIGFLREAHVHFGGYMVAAMALMEAPAIVSGLMLIRRNEDQDTGNGQSIKYVVREALTNGSVILITGSLLVGLAANEKALAGLEPFTDGIFKGMLAFFLLDMGLLAGKRIGNLKSAGVFVLAFALGVPLLNACIAMGIGIAMHWPLGNAFLLTLLAASASYIAVPAAMRVAVPQANAGLYVPMSLGITFPLNIVVGIPVYYYILSQFLQP